MMPGEYAFIYSSRFGDFSFGRNHPFKVERFALTCQLLDSPGLLSKPAVRVAEAPPRYRIRASHISPPGLDNSR